MAVKNIKLLWQKKHSLEKYDQQIQQSFVRDVDSIVQKLNTSFQQDLKDEAEAESFFMA